jgi:hypothetical protein
MNIKNKIINIITFIANLLVSAVFVLLGWVSGYGGETNYLIILIGIILFIFSFRILVKNSFRSYIISVLIAIGGILGWVLVVASMDMKWLLLGYLIVFLPLSLYKYKLNKNKSPENFEQQKIM